MYVCVGIRVVVYLFHCVFFSVSFFLSRFIHNFLIPLVTFYDMMYISLLSFVIYFIFRNYIHSAIFILIMYQYSKLCVCLYYVYYY